MTKLDQVPLQSYCYWLPTSICNALLHSFPFASFIHMSLYVFILLLRPSGTIPCFILSSNCLTDLCQNSSQVDPKHLPQMLMLQSLQWHLQLFDSWSLSISYAFHSAISVLVTSSIAWSYSSDISTPNVVAGWAKGFAGGFFWRDIFLDWGWCV